VHNFLRVNEFEGTTYFNKERFEELLRWILLFHLNEIPSRINETKADSSKLKKADYEKEIVKKSKESFERFIELINKAETSGYDFIKFQKELDKYSEKKTKTIIKKRKKV
jgi:HEPN domain-containing protein